MTKRQTKIENIFNAAEEVIENLEVDDEKLITMGPASYEIDEVGDIEETDTVFEVMELKKDFIMVKRNLQKLVRQGQNLMDGVGIMHLDDMNGAQMSGIAQLSDVIGNQLKMMIEMYKDISEIERNKKPQNPLVPGNVTGDLNQNILFTGTTADLLAQFDKK